MEALHFQEIKGLMLMFYWNQIIFALFFFSWIAFGFPHDSVYNENNYLTPKTSNAFWGFACHLSLHEGTISVYISKVIDFYYLKLENQIAPFESNWKNPGTIISEFINQGALLKMDNDIFWIAIVMYFSSLSFTAETASFLHVQV